MYLYLTQIKPPGTPLVHEVEELEYNTRLRYVQPGSEIQKMYFGKGITRIVKSIKLHKNGWIMSKLTSTFNILNFLFYNLLPRVVKFDKAFRTCLIICRLNRIEVNRSC